VTSSVVIGNQQLSPIIGSCEKVPATVRHRHSCGGQQNRRHRSSLFVIITHRYPMHTVVIAPPLLIRACPATQQ
jgi:hypothetical protein